MFVIMLFLRTKDYMTFLSIVELVNLNIKKEVWISPNNSCVHKKIIINIKYIEETLIQEV